VQEECISREHFTRWDVCVSSWVDVYGLRSTAEGIEQSTTILPAATGVVPVTGKEQREADTLSSLLECETCWRQSTVSRVFAHSPIAQRFLW
jgi:hypothetical protein